MTDQDHLASLYRTFYNRSLPYPVRNRARRKINRIVMRDYEPEVESDMKVIPFRGSKHWWMMYVTKEKAVYPE